MKKISTYLSVVTMGLIGMVAIWSCSDKDGTMEVDPSLLQTDRDTLRFSESGGETRLNVMTLKTWVGISGDDSWCVVRRTGSLLSVTAQTNRGDARTTTVKIQADDIVKEVTILQRGIDATQKLVLTTDRVEMTCIERGTVGVKAITAWDVVVPEEAREWCKIEKNPMGGMLISVLGNEDRTAELQVVSGEEVKPLTVKQKKYHFTYKVGELYQDENGEISGIIFESDALRGEARVLSIQEGNVPFMQPGDPDVNMQFGFTSSAQAIEWVKSRYPDTWHTKFPVLAWCDDLNTRYKTTGWLLMESSDMFGTSDVYEQLLLQNPAIVALGGTILPPKVADGALGGEHTLLPTVREYNSLTYNRVTQRHYDMTNTVLYVNYERTELVFVRAVKKISFEAE